jgi:2'-hydroxyisoflavone reductase
VANIRPGLIVGPNDPTDRFTYWPVRVARGGEVLAPGNATDPVQIIDVRDLAQWMVSLIERNRTGVYNAVGPSQPLPMGELLAACKRASGSDATFTWVPASFLEQQKVSPWSDMPVWVPPEGDSAGFGSMSNARAVAEGLRFRSIEQTAKDTLAWWSTLPEPRRAKLGAGVTAERETEVLRAWKDQKTAHRVTPVRRRVTFAQVGRF